MNQKLLVNGVFQSVPSLIRRGVSFIRKIATPDSDIPVVVTEADTPVECFDHRHGHELHVVKVLLADPAPVSSRAPLPACVA